MIRLLTLLLVLSGSAFAQSAASTFVLDPAKPFVYLKFDHIGVRQSVGPGEGEKQLWVRVVNNCRLPIVLRASGGGDGQPGVDLEDEVVPIELGMQIFSSEQADATAQERKDRDEALRHKPEGYFFEVSGVAKVMPGNDLLFSVPMNHVGRFWYLRIRFTLALDKSSIAVGPFTYLEFHDYDIPKK